MQVGVAGDVPAVLHVVRLPLVGEVAAAGRALHREPPTSPGVHGLPVVVEHRRLVAGDRVAGGAAAHALGRVRDEDVDHLGRADAVDDLDAGRLLEELARRVGQRLAGRDAFLQAATDRSRCASGAICRYMIGEVKQTVALKRSMVSSSDSRRVASRPARVEAPKRIGKHSMPPRPKVKASGGVPQKMSSLCTLSDRAREAVAHRDHVAMEVHRALRLAGGAGGEGDQRHVVGRGRHVGERERLLAAPA